MNESIQNLLNSALLQHQAFINGEWCDADSQQTFVVENPATGEEIARVSNVSEAETVRAIAAANQALPAWRALPAAKRSAYLMRWYQLIIEQQEALARLLSLEQGKPLAEARGEILYGASFVEWFAEEGKRVYGETIPTTQVSQRLCTIKQPIGVVAAITPWNFPNAMVTRKVAPALAAGCSIVLKPAPDTPLSALALAELARQAGFPAGIFNVLPTSDAASVGRVLTESPIVRKLSFTGSTNVGRLLMQQCSPTLKKLSLELGGNAPFIVFDDADLDAAVRGAVAIKFRNSGQTCVSANRILVQDGVYEQFAHKLAEAVKALKVGAWNEEGSQIGPLINSKALAKVQSHVDDALKQGARLLTGSQSHARGGHFFSPTVLADMNSHMLMTHEETFGPVAPLFRFHTEREAIEFANQTLYGLASYFYSRDIGRALRVAEALESGMVGINESLISNAVAPFGGIKQSGIGREGAFYGIEEYLEVKYLCFGGIEPDGA